jgi:hypothetical protein
MGEKQQHPNVKKRILIKQRCQRSKENELRKRGEIR